MSWSDDVGGKLQIRNTVRKILEGYVIMEMYTNLRNPGYPNYQYFEINNGRYWTVKLKHHSSGHIMDLHEDEPTV